MAAAAGLWGAERAFRFARFTRINALFGKRQHEPIVAGRPYRDTPATPEDAYGMRELKGTHGLPYAPYTDKTLPRSPGDETPWTPATDAPKNEFGARSEIAYYDESSLQPLGSYDARQIDPYSRDNASRPSTSTLVSKDGGYFPVLEKERPLSHSGHTYGKESIATVTAPSRGPSLSPPIPIGFAQAQLLPSSTIRLTIRVAHPFKWAPGQNVLLYLPDLSRIQSHPFTIINNTGPEIVLLVKARKGVTRRLFDLVRTRSLAAVGLNGATDKRLSLASMRGGEGCVQVPPVYVRTWIDGPFGSSSRSRWGEFSSVLIICGGSGISFGASICDHICRTMVQGQAGKRFQVQRVRLCWVVREYAEIAWVAGQLRRCQEMVTAAQLQIDIFVTNASKVRDDFAPPRPGFAGGGHDRRGSTDSVTSEISQDFAIDDNESIDTRDSSAHYADIIDLTNYEDEEDVNDPVEHRLSDRLQHQGKVRRANSRKAGRRTAKQASKTSSYPPHRQQHSILSPYEDASGAEMAARGSNYDARSPEETPFAPPHPILSGNDSRRHSYRSVAESAYGRYDPFSGGQAGQYGPSPSPSLMFDDNQSVAGESVHNLLSRASRAGSMVLLEDNSGEPTGDAALWVEQSDYSAMSVLSEMARPGKPKLSSVLEEEIQQARGSMMVASE